MGLTFDDVSLSTLHSQILPADTNLETNLSNTVHLNIPIISSDMDTVTEGRMAIAMALQGGMGLIHYNMPKNLQIKEVAKVKNHVHGLIQDPITITGDMTIGDVMRMVHDRDYSFRTFPVIDEKRRLIGLLPGRIVKERYSNRNVAGAMMPRKDLWTLSEEAIKDNPIGAADKFFDEHIGIHKVLVVDDKDTLRGLFTMSDIDRISEEGKSRNKPARDSNFRLLCGAAISGDRNPDGSLNRDKIIEHVGNLVDEGIDAVAVSTAHGHTQGVGDTTRIIRDAFPDLTIIAGNVTSGSGVEFLADAGANAIKIGQGPGSICTTRVVAGVGIPQLTALFVASRAAQAKGVKIIADGGINKSGDIVKALTLADAVICGGLLAGCKEAPGSIIEIDGKFYKQYRGMGSRAAMVEGSAARYGHKVEDIKQKATAEGVEALKEVSGELQSVIRELAGGIQSGMGYLGAENLSQLKEKARYIRVSPAGQKESGTHDIIEIKTNNKAN
jgi:IMP dehydrogenase